MTISHRRRFLKSLLAAPLALSLVPDSGHTQQCRVQHPFMPPDSQFHGQCPVCGMVRPMWARTWITFDPVKKVSQVCSFHCMADWILKSGQSPTNVMLTVYHQPQESVPADSAFIVIGSTAAGTMSPVSKIVFADRAKAEKFASTCSGAVIDYSKALLTAKTGVNKENAVIHDRRINKGKIVEPGDSDYCVVCGMFPARYAYGKCQIRTRNGKTLHFCSTQCLFAFIGRQALYVQAPVDPFLIWVVDRPSGMWISGRTAFYAIGSSKIFGPMGYEAFPFTMLQDAEAFASENGGKALIFSDVTIEKVVPQWKYIRK